MPYKNLEHDGDEEFDTKGSYKKRKDVILDKKASKKLKEDSEFKKLADLQEQYNSPNNPLLWENF